MENNLSHIDRLSVALAGIQSALPIMCGHDVSLEDLIAQVNYGVDKNIIAGQATLSREYLFVSVDIETWGLRPGCAIRSIGAVVMNAATQLPAEGFDPFMVNITTESCVKAGLTLDPATVEWWDKQSDAAKAAVSLGAIDLDVALDLFSAWYENETPPVDDLPAYGNGKEIDICMVESAYKAVGQTAPWSWRTTADVRTLIALARSVGLDFKDKHFDQRAPDDVEHVSLNDAIFQGTYTAATIDVLRRILAIGVQTLVNHQLDMIEQRDLEGEQR